MLLKKNIETNYWQLQSLNSHDIQMAVIKVHLNNTSSKTLVFLNLGGREEQIHYEALIFVKHHSLIIEPINKKNKLAFCVTRVQRGSLSPNKELPTWNKAGDSRATMRLWTHFTHKIFPTTTFIGWKWYCRRLLVVF